MAGSLTSRTILVVDDEFTLLKLLKALLEGAGFQVLTARSAAEALAMCRRTKIDLLLAKVGVPGLLGPQVARDIATKLAPDAKVLFMSGSDGIRPSDTEFSWLECGVLQKPFSPADLLNAVDGALDLFSAPTDSQPQAPPGPCGCQSAKGAAI